MKNRTSIMCALLFLVIAMMAGCQSNPAGPTGSTPGAPTGAYVVNEGNFQRGNASLTFYMPDSNKAYQNVFTLANGRDLGDTGNDIAIYGGKAYIVVNGSQKVEVISTADNKSVGTFLLPGQRSPYRIVILSDAKAYVTNVMDSSVTAFNPSTLQIVFDRVKVGANPQGIASANGKLYVCNSGYGYDNTVTVLNAGTGAFIKTVVVGDSPSEVGVGPNNVVIVKCDGKSDYSNSANDTPGSISVITSDNDVVITKAILPVVTYGHPGHMTVSGKGYGFFVGKTGIIRFSFTSSTLNVEGTPFSTMQAYSLTIDDATDRLYATDPKDYVQLGEVAIIDSKGVEMKRFTAGIIPGAIAFKQ
ncbi:MAG: YncE family protein [Ignavibacteriales bacterium]|nr:YncE family protein [Ignavibacteriales bacterium]